MATEQTFCTDCGAAFPAGARFCRSCGSSVDGQRRFLTAAHGSEQRNTVVSGFWAGLTGKPYEPASPLPRSVDQSAPERLRRDEEPQGLDDPRRNSPSELPESREANRYNLLSGLLLLSIPAASLIAVLIFRYQSYDWVNAIGVLIVPFAIACWIFTTLRAIHLLDVRFWFVPSTYIGLIGGVLALLICLIMFVFSTEAERRGHRVTDMTLYAAAAILYGGCVVWSYVYNWRKTGSAILSISLTLLQTISAAFVIVALYLWVDGRNTKQYEREHGIS
ncbi:zinc ribbon domain-containing protein [Bradyrhizobium sp. RT3b]|uniref:zinc ribbon domain-containing protein n=1 Tax=Bradyrhizobium sp. RT3b TaxID=3156334 RepID=UPI0033926F3C